MVFCVFCIHISIIAIFLQPSKTNNFQNIFILFVLKILLDAFHKAEICNLYTIT
jgi:hypothetical protein